MNVSPKTKENDFAKIGVKQRQNWRQMNKTGVKQKAKLASNEQNWHQMKTRC